MPRPQIGMGGPRAVRRTAPCIPMVARQTAGGGSSGTADDGLGHEALRRKGELRPNRFAPDWSARDKGACVCSNRRAAISRCVLTPATHLGLIQFVQRAIGAGGPADLRG